ncbi:MAG TPA: hypothetical protein DEH25_16535 [Chloroflexi bacterium]|nr:hypothetical protein [Chloroflexota bacterium]HBY07312.1 hypothetical protein [Chloroflexota bacterium]
MSPDLITFLTKILIALAIGVGGYLVAWIVGRLIKSVLVKFISATWAAFLANIVTLGIMLYAIKLILNLTGAAGTFALIVAGFGAAMTMGSDDAAKDFVSGVKLFFLKYYGIDDMVTIAGFTGYVTEITMTNTTLSTTTRDSVIIPNSQVLKHIIINHSKIPGHVVSTVIPIPGEHDREKVMQILQDGAKDFSLRMEDTTPVVTLDDLGIKTSYYKIITVVEEVVLKPSTPAKLRLEMVNALERAGVPVGEAEVVKFVK